MNKCNLAIDETYAIALKHLVFRSKNYKAFHQYYIYILYLHFFFFFPASPRQVQDSRGEHRDHGDREPPRLPGHPERDAEDHRWTQREFWACVLLLIVVCSFLSILAC